MQATPHPSRAGWRRRRSRSTLSRWERVKLAPMVQVPGLVEVRGRNISTELRRGSLTEQFLMVKRKDGSRVKRGPYPLLTRKQGQKTISRRLTDPALLPLYRRQIQAMRQFEGVVEGLVRVGEQLSDLVVAEAVQKKLLVELEQAAEVRRLAVALAARQTPDFEAWESLLLQAARQGGLES